MSLFSSVELLPEDPILNLPILFAKDSHDHKVNLGIGAYQDDNGHPAVLSCVRKAEKILLEKNLNKEYLPIQGSAEFISVINKLIYGYDSQKLSTGQLFLAQTVGGTFALRVAGEFLSRTKHIKLYLPNPTWPNHPPIFTYAGLQLEKYPYYDHNRHCLDFPNMCSAIEKMPPGSAIILHACCHNPTGVDPSIEQWKELSDIILKQKVLPFFDLAYQGFGSGLEQDAFPVRYFAEQGHEMFVASSCSKNFGLYGERVGSLSVITHDSQITRRVASQIKQIVRASCSMPPLQGARIVSTILQSEQLTGEWQQELSQMRQRIKEMRHHLVEGLEQAGISQDVRFFEKQLGIFSFTGLSPKQVQRLRQEFGVYAADNGRINIAGLNSHNVKYVISSLASILKS